MTAHGYFVTGTDTEIGKTLVATCLLRSLTRTGLRTAGMKPVAAGAQFRDGAWHNEDCDAIAAQASVVLPPRLTTPYLFRHATAPHVAATLEGSSINLQTILDCYHQVAARADVVVIEGVGGFRVPLNGSTDTADLAQQLGLPVVLVVGLRLGCINHALLTAEAIAARGLPLVGWVANTVDPDMLNSTATVEAIAARLNAPMLGQIPRLRASGPKLTTDALEHLDLSGLPPLAFRNRMEKHSSSAKEI